MRTHMTNRTKVTLLAGTVLFGVGGGGAAYLSTRDAGSASSIPKVEAYYAAAPVETGTAGSAALAQGLIRSKSVLPADLPLNSVADPTQLAGRVAGTSIPAGTLVTTDMFPDPQTRIGTVVIPPGKRALALELAPLAGLAGFAGAGDRVDVYAITGGEDAAAPAVRLVLQAIEVLKVNGAGLAAAQGQPGSPNLIYLLAVSPADAERLIFLNEFERIYFDLVPKGEGAVKTPGAGAASAVAV